MADPTAEQLTEVLADATRLGILGTDDVEQVIAHARGFAAVLRSPNRVLDLGSGAGVPGLVLAVDDPDLAVVLLEGAGRRADLLRRAVARLGLQGRVEVVGRRAEEVGRDPQWRGQLDAVVVRSFGSPGLVAECAAPLLRVGGQLVVSEPPDADAGRWPAEGLQTFGLVADEAGDAAGVASFTQVHAAPDRFPRARLRAPLF